MSSEKLWGLDVLTKIVHCNVEPLTTNRSSAYRDFKCLICGEIHREHINGIFVEPESTIRKYWSKHRMCKENLQG
ncbi:MAG: hypothetical protein SNJ29_15190 [Rikenellaceae bacterium]